MKGEGREKISNCGKGKEEKKEGERERKGKGMERRGDGKGKEKGWSRKVEVKEKKCFVKFKMNLLVFTQNKGFEGRLCICPVRGGGTSLSPPDQSSNRVRIMVRL